MRLVILVGMMAGEPAALQSSSSIDFRRDIRPILADHCFRCHGPDEGSRKAELRLDTPAGAFGDRGGYAAFVRGSPHASEAIRRLVTEDPEERMPPPGAPHYPTPAQIEALRQWVAQGATWQEHWALEDLRGGRTPQFRNRAWPRRAIDAFVLARLEQESLEPAPEADRPTLIRRLSLDLVGLPPSPEEVDRFLADRAPDAYDRLVDRLLASPRYGERMAWDWLDAARYADSNGYQGDPERTMWPWRDWVTGALNAGMPFDRFTIEQLAGDLVPGATGATLQQRIATGFHRNHMHNGEGGRIPEETRVENVMDRVETTATVWLGATMTCARCHDHKYDPFTMRDYYSLFAFFNNTSEDGRGRSGQAAPAVTVLSDDQRERLAELDRKIDEAAQAVAAAERRQFPDAPMGAGAQSGSGHDLPKEIAAWLAIPPGRRSADQIKKLRDHFQAEADHAGALGGLLEVVSGKESMQAMLPRVMVMDELANPRETFILTRGAYDRPGPKVTADVPASLPALSPDWPRNRLALARWLAAPEGPLAPRVIVNRHWQTFFGSGLVQTPEDFGRQGKLPSHPELLDWLAAEFVRTGWDVKRLHLVVTTSATYRQSSKLSRSLLERDPENRLLARGPRYRLPSWMIRDQALGVSGLLVERLGGEPVKPYQPAGVWDEATFGKKQYVQDHGADLYRRSIYTFWRRIIGPTMFFDTASRQTCSVTVARTNTPLHSLVTLNDVTFVEAARVLAQRVLLEADATTPSRIEWAFRLVTARRPSPAEMAVLSGRFERLKEEFQSQPQAARTLQAVGESVPDEHLDPCEHAALAALCSLILNLDEALTKQ